MVADISQHSSLPPSPCLILTRLAEDGEASIAEGGVVPSKSVPKVSGMNFLPHPRFLTIEHLTEHLAKANIYSKVAIVTVKAFLKSQGSRGVYGIKFQGFSMEITLSILMLCGCQPYA